MAELVTWCRIFRIGAVCPKPCDDCRTTSRNLALSMQAGGPGFTLADAHKELGMNTAEAHVPDSAVARLRGILARDHDAATISALLDDVLKQVVPEALAREAGLRNELKQLHEDLAAELRTHPWGPTIDLDTVDHIADLIAARPKPPPWRIDDGEPIPYTLTAAAGTCHDAEVDGEPVRYHGHGELTPAAADALGALVRTARQDPSITQWANEWPDDWRSRDEELRSMELAETDLAFLLDPAAPRCAHQLPPAKCLHCKENPDA